MDINVYTHTHILEFLSGSQEWSEVRGKPPKSGVLISLGIT